MDRTNTVVLAVLAGVLCGLALVFAAAPAPTALIAEAAPIAAPPAAAPTNAREQFATDLLAALGNTSPSADTIDMVVEWTLAEDSGDGALARHNPLNTTQPSGDETQVINEDGVRGYASYDAGMRATVQTITNGLYNDVVAALQANDPARARQALWASPWAGSHYGYGASWPHYGATE